MNAKQHLRTLIAALLAFLSFASATAANQKHFSLWVGEKTNLRTNDIQVPFGWDKVLPIGYVWDFVGDADEYIGMMTGEWTNINEITLNKFFTGTKRIKCTTSYYYYRLTAGKQEFSDFKKTVDYFYIECNTVGVSLYPEQMELNLGESRALQYKFSPATSQPAATVSFTSSNPKVAEVDFEGNVFAVGIGSATITAKTNFETTATCQVKVNPIRATSIALNHNVLTLYAGDKATLTATIKPSNATDKSVSWASNNEKVVKVSQKGEVTAVGTGRAQVTATTRDGSKLTAACNVTVNARAESLTFDVGEKTIGIGETFMIVPNVKPEGASPQLTWKSSDPAVAYVDANGRVEGFKTGTANITATTTDGSNLTATCRVTVIKYATSIALNHDELTLYAGEKATLTATVKPGDATDKSVSWASSDEEVVKVSQTGEMTAVGTGHAQVTATTRDGSNLTAACNVTVNARAESLTFDVEEKSISVGETFTLTPNVQPEEASPRLTWESSDPAVAHVDENGHVEGITSGTADITATTTDGSNLTATCHVTVIKYVSSIELNEDEMTLFAGETKKLIATVIPMDATNRTLAWTSTDEAVATVEDGIVTARSKGSASIIATSTDGSNIQAVCHVTVGAQAESLTFDVEEKTINVGETFTLVPNVQPEGASPRLTWKSSDPAVAYVDGNGRVEGFKTGTADITATTTDGSDLTATCRVTVIRYVSSIDLNEDEMTLFAGETRTLTATVNPTDATNRKLAWTSTDEAVATVEDGTVTARGNGSATVVATSTDGSNIQAVCRVTVTTPVGSIELSETQMEMRPGDFKVLTATVLPESASDNTLAWSSSAPEVADVQNGIILAYSNGTALVTAAATDGSGVTATCEVTVSNTVGIDDMQAMPQVSVKGRHIMISGIADGTVCKIYRSNGTEVYSGPARNGSITCTADAGGTYIVCTGNHSCKVLVVGNE